MDSDMKLKIDNCCQTAEDFTRLYYNAIDKRRHQISRLYLDNAIFIWNGNAAIGTDKIQKFLIELPSSEHNVTTLDAQPILDDAVGSQITYMIQAAGTVKYQDQPTKVYSQSFVVTAQADKWKIASDSFRLQDSLATDS